MDQKSTPISDWLQPDQIDASITARQLGEGVARHHQLGGRVSLTINMGAATVHLRPTAAEVRSLINVLEWSLAAPREAHAVASLDQRRERMLTQLETGIAAALLP